MSRFALGSRLALQGPVGNGRDNGLDDVLAVKRRLHGLGLYGEPVYGFTGYIDRDTELGIRRFQAANDLKVDGFLAPGGETERALDGAAPAAPTKRRSLLEDVAAIDPVPGGVPPDGIVAVADTRKRAAGAPATARSAAPPPQSALPRNPDPNYERKLRFINHNLPLAQAIGEKYGFDPVLLLAIGAHESDWGESRMAQTAHNPLGMTPRGDATPGLRFADAEAAYRRWGDLFGPRVRDLGGDVEKFIANLQVDNRTGMGPTIGGDRRGAYNSEKREKWEDGVRGTHRSIHRMLPNWP